MKKLLSLLLTLALAAGMTGCTTWTSLDEMEKGGSHSREEGSASSTSQEGSGAASSSDGAIPVQGTVQNPIQQGWGTFEVEMRSEGEEIYYSDKEGVMAYVSLEYPYLTAPQGNQEMERAARDFNQKIDQRRADFQDSKEELFRMALESYEGNPEYFYGPYYEEETASVEQVGHLISVDFQSYAYMGGAHGSGWDECWLYNCESLELMDFLDLAKDEDGLRQTVEDEILEQIREKVGDEYMWTDYQFTVSEWPFFPCCIHQGSLVVIFGVYTLASYADGDQVFSIPLSDLKPYLSEEGLRLLGM